MALLASSMAGTGTFTAQRNLTKYPFPSLSSSLSHLSLPSPNSSNNSRQSATHIARARKGLSSRTRRLEKRGKNGAVTTPTKEEEEMVAVEERAAASFDIGVGVGEEGYSTEPPPKLPGEEPDFWEGPQWNAFGFFVQYMWAFGIVFGLIACGIAVATYNEGATDFKKTPVFKESIQSRELLEEPEASGSDVFEANPTEEAPSLE